MFTWSPRSSQREASSSRPLRDAPQADLLVTHPQCAHAWPVQVKTNAQLAGFWLMNKDAGAVRSESHIYVFVNLKPKDQPPEFFVVPSPVVAQVMRTDITRTGSTWYSFNKNDVAAEYHEFFGGLHARRDAASKES